VKTIAAVSTGPVAPFTIQELDLADPQPDELLVRVEAAGICHTDLATKAMFPDGVAAVFGHEGAGVVEVVGSAVTDVRPGDKVIISFASCGVCDRCTAGRPGYCVRFQPENVSGAPTLSGPGGPVAGKFFGQSSFARHALTNRRQAVVVGPDVDLTLVASYGCGVQTGAGAVVNVLQPGPGSSLAVFGLGGVGMAAVMAGAALGVEQIIGVDLAESRRDTALKVGATHALHGADPGLLDQLRELTGGGATHALDTTAVPAVIRTAGEALATRGTLVVVGVGPDATFNIGDLIGGGKTIRGCIEGDADPQTFIPRLLAWDLPMHEIVRTYPFAEINQAVAGGAIKPVLVFED
jgi:aryl-alcohol dehydrogenase